MFDPKFAITSKITNALLKIERARGFLDAANLKEAWIRDMQSEALVLEAHHSTHIEGTQLTLPQAHGILAGKSVKAVRADDRQELLNYKKAMDFVSAYLGKKLEITEELIKEIHNILVTDVRGGTLEPGRYRTVQNYVLHSITKTVMYTPPPPAEVPNLMQEFVEWLNQESDMSPVLIAGISQFQFVNIHPFLDGNGRTARVLCSLILYQNGYDFKRLFSLSEYYDKDRLTYYEVLQAVRRNNMDFTGWLEYFTEGLRSQLGEVKIKGEKAIKRDVLHENLKEKVTLNQRQQTALDYLIEHNRIDNATYRELCSAIKRTATRDLTELVNLGLIERHGEKKGTYYTLKLFER
jgi:Fic family protein